MAHCMIIVLPFKSFRYAEVQVVSPLALYVKRSVFWCFFRIQKWKES